MERLNASAIHEVAWHIGRLFGNFMDSRAPVAFRRGRRLPPPSLGRPLSRRQRDRRTHAACPSRCRAICPTRLAKAAADPKLNQPPCRCRRTHPGRALAGRTQIPGTPPIVSASGFTLLGARTLAMSASNCPRPSTQRATPLAVAAMMRILSTNCASPASSGCTDIKSFVFWLITGLSAHRCPHLFTCSISRSRKGRPARRRPSQVARRRLVSRDP